MCLLWLIVRASFSFFVCVSCGGWAASIPAPWRQEETRDCSPTPQAVRFHGGICHSPRTSTTQSSWCANSWSHSYLPKIEKNAYWGQRKWRSGDRPEKWRGKRIWNDFCLFCLFASEFWRQAFELNLALEQPEDFGTRICRCVRGC